MNLLVFYLLAISINDEKYNEKLLRNISNDSFAIFENNILKYLLGFFSIFAYNLHSLYPIYCCSIQHMLRAVTWQQFDHSDKYSGMIGD